MHTKRPISSTENPIFILLILINETYALIPIVGSILKFYVMFLNMLVFQTIWRNKKRTKKHKNKMKKEEKSVFKLFEKFTDKQL